MGTSYLWYGCTGSASKEVQRVGIKQHTSSKPLQDPRWSKLFASVLCPTVYTSPVSEFSSLFLELGLRRVGQRLSNGSEVTAPLAREERGNIGIKAQ